jgi:ATP-dependent exoDNAse (exonuclease V) beta subunit
MRNRKVIKASAGTGKTYRLALEYISRLLLGEDYNEILFITFTRKATAELKIRLFEFLDMLSKGDKELEGNIKTLYPQVVINSQNIKNIREHLLQNKDKIRIHTIDSFTSQIFKKAIGPYLNIYGYSMSNKAGEEEVFEEVFTRLVSGNNFDKVKNFLEKTADRNIDKYMNLIKKICEERWKFSIIKKKKYKN